MRLSVRILGFNLLTLGMLGLEEGRWLMAGEPAFRSIPIHPAPGGAPGFTEQLAADTGVNFFNRLPIERSLTNHILLNGSGVALGDVDEDGWCDVFFAGLGGGSTFYRNLGGWRFSDVTKQSFSAKPAGGLSLNRLDATGAVFADLDGDGHLDLLVNTIGHGVRAFRSNGQGVFRDVTSESGLGGTSGGTSLALADVDGDGDLDLYVVNYRTSTVRDEFQQRFEIKVVSGKPVVASVNGRSSSEPDLVGRFSVDAEGHITENGEADAFYLNDGHGRFSLVSFTGGSFRDEHGAPLPGPPYDWGLAAMFRDLDGDGSPDLYVCNDLNSPDRIWLNDGHGVFSAIPRLALRKTSWFSMGVDFGDLNRDGWDDFLVTDMLSRDPARRQAEAVSRIQPVEPFTGLEARPQVPRNTLFIGRGKGSFTEAACMAGLAASDWSWSPVLLDVDLDGYEDVLITTGFERDVQDVDVAAAIEEQRRREKLSDSAAIQLRRRFPSLELPNVAFRNRGDLAFEDASKAWGFDHFGISQGMALADLDDDGDLDVVINNQNAPATLLRNNASGPRLAVKLRGVPPNTQAIGARVEVFGGPVRQSQEVIAGGRYLSGDEPSRTFATGGATNLLGLRVAWRDGRETILTNLAANQRIEIQESTNTLAVVRTIAAIPSPLFEDASGRLGHRHQEEPFDDSQRQPLLPRSLSGLGPAVCWGDLNGDGFDDLVIGTGRGGLTGVFLNDRRGGFEQGGGPLFERPAVMDQAGILIRHRGTNAVELLIATSNYENPTANSTIRNFDYSGGVVRLGGPSLRSSVGPLAQSDVDGDGELDLFVGGRVVPGRYPQPASSALFLGRPEGFAPDVSNTGVLANLGLVSGAVFTDLDGDGRPDLVVACEWGAVRVFMNDRGRLSERDFPVDWESATGRPFKLSGLTGWWNGVTAVDLDGDGRMDLVVSNWGLNTRHRASVAAPTRLYSGAMDPAGPAEATDLLLTYTDTASGRELPCDTFPVLAAAMPFLRDRFPTQRSFGEASVGRILGERHEKVARFSINTLESMVLLNRGDRFEARPLPPEAQMAPAMAVVAADFNGDGHEDVFLGQNFFDVGPEADRPDSGLGLLLLGDGRGGLKPLSASDSGINVLGQQRAAAAADYDQDGRMDLVVTQNGELTRLFHNRLARPGLRVRLVGPAGNPDGVGSVLRLVDQGGRMGPAREIHAGSGYWSTDGPAPVLGAENRPEALWIRWPGHSPQIVALRQGSLEILVKAP